MYSIYVSFKRNDTQPYYTHLSSPEVYYILYTTACSIRPVLYAPTWVHLRDGSRGAPRLFFGLKNTC